MTVRQRGFSGKEDRTPSVKSAERVLDLLETIGRHKDGATFAELNTGLGIPKSSLHSLLGVLLARGYIEFQPASRKHVLGIALWETGQSYQRHHGVIAESRAVLERIVAEVNETAQLARLSGTDNVYLAKVDSSHALRLQSEVGTRLPAHATGVGKALLAQLDREEIEALYPDGSLTRYTANTLGTRAQLFEELDVIRARGFAIDNQEYTWGVFCVAVPVRDSAAPAGHALSVSVPVMRASAETLTLILRKLAGGAVSIARRCGIEPDPLLARLSDEAEAAAAIGELLGSSRYNFVSPQVPVED